MSNAIRITTALFDAKIAQGEVQYLRGNIIKMSDFSPLFHNHNVEGFHYAYPLIQYKRINGYAAVIGINEGSSAVVQLLGGELPQWLHIGRRITPAGDTSINTQEVTLECDSTMRTYEITRWLPLNQYNHSIYLQKRGLVGKLTMLESILTGNILSFAKGVGIFFDNQVECCITDIQQGENVQYKSVELTSFNAKFDCNIPLPEYIGLGKSASLGNGIIKRVK
jgi:hypothetical protein